MLTVLRSRRRPYTAERSSLRGDVSWHLVLLDHLIREKAIPNVLHVRRAVGAPIYI